MTENEIKTYIIRGAILDLINALGARTFQNPVMKHIRWHEFTEED